MSTLEQLEPRLIWSRFLELTRIPRPPKHEDAVRAHVLEWASRHGLAADVDAAGNVLVRVPASAGREDAATVVLQGHLDMVCERDPLSANDPREGRIDVILDGDWVVADGTTLGADNGIGVAAAMAAGEDPELVHGPLELLFTVSEEQGLDGAKALDPDLVTGRLLLNLDGGDEGVTIGCAGSIHTFTRLPLALEPVPAGQVALDVRLLGARGGHSGGDIASGRVNANKALGRVLARAQAAIPFRLALIEGGVSRNAIPRQAHAVLTLAPESESAFRESAEAELGALREQYSGTDDALELAIEGRDAVAADVAGETATGRALDLLAVLPTGVVAMNPQLEGEVETSTSVTVVTTDDGVVTFGSMTRSASAVALEDVVAGIEAAARLAGAQVEVLRSYPPWRPHLDSRLLAVAQDTFRRVFDIEPALKIVHGGLECAVIGDKLPGVEMVSFGPEIEGPHAPGERLRVSSTASFYRYLGALLDDLSR